MQIISILICLFSHIEDQQQLIQENLNFYRNNSEDYEFYPLNLFHIIYLSQDPIHCARLPGESIHGCRSSRGFTALSQIVQPLEPIVGLCNKKDRKN